MSSTDSGADPRQPIAHDEGLPPAPARTRLQRLRLPIMGAVVVLVLVGALVVYLTGGRYESTDDAEIQGARVAISSTIAGRVMNIAVRDNQVVHAGQLLFQLDGRPYQTAYQEAQANLAAARLQVEGLGATVGQRQADLAAAEDRQTYLEADAVRQKALVGAGTATQAQADQAASLAAQGRQHHHAGNRRQRQRQMIGGTAQHSGEAGAVHADHFRLLDEDGQEFGDAQGGGLAEHGNRKRAARQQYKGGDFGGFDDVAGFARLVEPLLCRLFGGLGIVMIISH